MIIKQSNPGVAFHGWKILFLAAFSQFVSVGFTVYLLGLYFKPLAEAFSATPGQLGWASSIFMLYRLASVRYWGTGSTRAW